MLLNNHVIWNNNEFVLSEDNYHPQQSWIIWIKWNGWKCTGLICIPSWWVPVPMNKDLLMRRDVVISQNISSLYPQGEDSVEYFLGLTPSGIILLRNKTKVGNYYWPRINKIYYKVKKFISRFFIPNKYRIYLYVNISPNIYSNYRSTFVWTF